MWTGGLKYKISLQIRYRVFSTMYFIIMREFVWGLGAHRQWFRNSKIFSTKRFLTTRCDCSTLLTPLVSATAAATAPTFFQFFSSTFLLPQAYHTEYDKYFYFFYRYQEVALLSTCWLWQGKIAEDGQSLSASNMLFVVVCCLFKSYYISFIAEAGGRSSRHEQ